MWGNWVTERILKLLHQHKKKHYDKWKNGTVLTLVSRTDQGINLSLIWWQELGHWLWRFWGLFLTPVNFIGLWSSCELLHSNFPAKVRETSRETRKGISWINVRSFVARLNCVVIGKQIRVDKQLYCCSLLVVLTESTTISTRTGVNKVSANSK